MKSIIYFLFGFFLVFALTLNAYALQYQGEWVGSVVYNPDDVVRYNADSSIYVCVSQNTGHMPSLYPAEWRVLVDSGAGGFGSWVTFDITSTIASYDLLLLAGYIEDNTNNIVQAECTLERSDFLLYGSSKSVMNVRKVAGVVTCSTANVISSGYSATCPLSCDSNVPKIKFIAPANHYIGKYRWSVTPVRQ